MATLTRTRALVAALIALRVLLVAMAAIAFYTGYALLTSPLLVPLTIGIWLSALVMLTLAVAAHLPAPLADVDRAVQQFHRRAA